MSIKRRLFGRTGLVLVVAFLLLPLLAACGGAADTPTPAAPAATDTPAAPAATDTPAAPAATDTPAAAVTPTEAAMAGETPTTGGTTGGTGGTLKVGLVTDVGRLNDKS